MYFTSNEVIELKGGKKHVVIATTEYHDEYYYYISELDKDAKKMIPKFKVITIVNNNGYLFIKTVQGDLEKELTSIFKKQLNIK